MLSFTLIQRVVCWWSFIKYNLSFEDRKTNRPSDFRRSICFLALFMSDLFCWCSRWCYAWNRRDACQRCGWRARRACRWARGGWRDHINRNDQYLTDLNCIWVSQFVFFDDIILCAVEQTGNFCQRIASLDNVINFCASWQIGWNWGGCKQFHARVGDVNFLPNFDKLSKRVDGWVELQEQENTLVAQVECVSDLGK